MGVANPTFVCVLISQLCGHLALSRACFNRCIDARRCHNLPYLGQPITVSEATRNSTRVSQVAGKYKITRGFDTW